ncbi:MAG: hypothetical protein EOM67_16915 [Spirochaetia bacterium]|nr:hypothetical protein [Spirochaetia bacterium]
MRQVSVIDYDKSVGDLVDRTLYRLMVNAFNGSLWRLLKYITMREENNNIVFYSNDDRKKICTIKPRDTPIGIISDLEVEQGFGHLFKHVRKVISYIDQEKCGISVYELESLVRNSPVFVAKSIEQLEKVKEMLGDEINYYVDRRIENKEEEGK